MPISREALTKSVEKTLELSDDGNTESFCSLILEALLSEEDTGRAAVENEEMFLDDLDPEFLASPTMFQNHMLWKHAKAAIKLLFPHISPFVDNPLQGIHRERNAVKVGSACIRRRIELGTSDPEDQGNYDNLWTVAEELYKESQSAETARRNFLPPPPSPTVDGQNVPQQQHQQNVSTPFISHSMVLDRLKKSVRDSFSTKHTDFRFSGDLKQQPPFDEWRSRCLTTIADLGTEAENDRVQLKLLNETLKGSAQRYLNTRIAPRLFHQRIPEGHLSDAGSLLSAIDKLADKFRTRDALSEIADEMKSLTLSKIRADQDLSVVDAIDVLKNKIELLSANGPREISTMDAMNTALTNAVVSEPWATEILAQQKVQTWEMPKFADILKAKVRTLTQKFPNLNARIDEKDIFLGKPSQSPTASSAVMLTDLHEPNLRNLPGGDLLGDQRSTPLHDSFYGEQRQTGAPRHPASQGTFRSTWPPNRPATQSTRRSSFENRPATRQQQRPFSGTCFRCNKPGHRARDCRSPLHVSAHDSIRSRLQMSAQRNGGRQDPYAVLYEIAMELNEAWGDCSSQGDDRLENNQHGVGLEPTEEEVNHVQNIYELFFTTDRDHHLPPAPGF